MRQYRWLTYIYVYPNEIQIYVQLSKVSGLVDSLQSLAHHINVYYANCSVKNETANVMDWLTTMCVPNICDPLVNKLSHSIV